MREFVALIRQGLDGRYRVSCPDFPTVTVDGKTLGQARIRVEYELFFHIRDLVADGQAIPEIVNRGYYDDPWYQGALETMTVAFVEIDADDDELKP